MALLSASSNSDGIEGLALVFQALPLATATKPLTFTKATSNPELTFYGPRKMILAEMPSDFL
jgi:hypothetical protein